MKRNPSKRALGLVGLATLFAAAPAAAQEVGQSYFGAGVGQSRAVIDEARITGGLLGGGLATTSFARDEHDLGYKLFGGYQFSRYLALEAGYFNLGSFGFTATTAPPGTLNGRIKLQGLNADLVGRFPLSQNLSLLGRVGAQHAWARDSFRGTGAVGVVNPAPRDHDTNLKLGIGLQYAISRSLMVRAEAERYRVPDGVGNRGTVNLLTLSLVVPFGGPPPEAPRQEPVAVYVAPPPPPPPPAPVVVVAPPPPPPPAPPPERRRVTLSAESLFSFDRSDLSASGREALDRFVREMGGVAFDTVTVEGHTDRLGSEGYNQKLSQARADAVKAYLAGPGGLAASRINTVGKGESSPVTRAGDCRGNAASPALIACLQPDRRVEIEVSGTR